MIWLILAGFAFVLFLDAYRCGMLDKVKEQLGKILKKVREWLNKQLFNRSKKQDK